MKNLFSVFVAVVVSIRGFADITNPSIPSPGLSYISNNVFFEQKFYLKLISFGYDPTKNCLQLVNATDARGITAPAVAISHRACTNSLNTPVVAVLGSMNHVSVFSTVSYWLFSIGSDGAWTEKEWGSVDSSLADRLTIRELCTSGYSTHCNLVIRDGHLHVETKAASTKKWSCEACSYWNSSGSSYWTYATYYGDVFYGWASPTNSAGTCGLAREQDQRCKP